MLENSAVLLNNHKCSKPISNFQKNKMESKGKTGGFDERLSVDIGAQIHLYIDIYGSCVNKIMESNGKMHTSEQLKIACIKASATFLEWCKVEFECNIFSLMPLILNTILFTSHAYFIKIDDPFSLVNVQFGMINGGLN